MTNENNIILRLPTVVGKDSTHTFIVNLVNDVIDFNINIYNPKNKFNSIIHVANLVNIIVSSVLKKKLPSWVYNIALDEYILLEDILPLISDTVKLHLPKIENTVTGSCSGLHDISKLKQYIELSNTKNRILKYLNNRKD
ncbi:hypothetical protein [Arcobacter sp. FWKO B]|uniref:hypothetical protein n=1 Tax=Arcobacter sp. FWKO B TaxID=2593672 RepID=UPI0018A49BC3|nr:hypothetical protein [Arcobacter sp. FWKO B]QOG12086.1 hypothetical protein FWKOB_04930 [Arcobacter sp. FWKO B]